MPRGPKLKKGFAEGQPPFSAPGARDSKIKNKIAAKTRWRIQKQDGG